MKQPRIIKFKKAIIVALVLLFVVGNVIMPRPAQANVVTVLTDIGGQAWDFTKYAAAETAAIFFQNAVGQLANQFAKETAIWVTTGGKGQGLQFYSNPTKMVTNMGDAAAGEFIQQYVAGIGGAGFDICNPQLRVDLVLQLPMFKERTFGWTGCTLSQLLSSDNWKNIGSVKIRNLIDGEMGIGSGGNFSKHAAQINNQISTETKLRIWNMRLVDPYEKNALRNCVDQPPDSVICDVPPAQDLLRQQAVALSAMIKLLEADARVMLEYAARPDDSVKFSVLNGQSLGKWAVRPENISSIKRAWLDRITPYSRATDDMVSLYTSCQDKTAEELKNNPGRCQTVLNDLRVRAVPVTATELQAGDSDIPTIFQTQYKEKVVQSLVYANDIKAGLEKLKTIIQDYLKSEYFETTKPYDSKMALQVFDPKNNQFVGWGNLATQVQEKSIDNMMKGNLDLMMNNGWKNATNTVAGLVKTPASLISQKAKTSLAGESAIKQRSGQIFADAVGVFMETLWNQMMRGILDQLYGGSEQEKASVQLFARSEYAGPATFDIYNPSEQQVISAEGIRSYYETFTGQYTPNYNLSDILPLFGDFQLNLKGRVNPNLYNNVIDTSFASAINDKLTIKEALDNKKLIGSYRFSWGSQVEPGTYHLANIQKLRKARVVPLGLELAVELIRDCQYRSTVDNNAYANFSDIDTIKRFGFDNPEMPYQTQKLQNCLFKPFVGDDLEGVKKYNADKMREVLNATLETVVKGFDQAGSGGCGNFDANESPFCNLVDPNWVLKIPPTKGSLPEKDIEPYGELLVSNQTGIHYSTYPDFASCLKEDGKGGCAGEDYGVCVKEQNVWRFNATSCPAQFNSCRTYSMQDSQGTRSVSYLKNTLSGSDVCGPDNAGCNWYATKKVNYAWADFASFTTSFGCTDSKVGGVWVAGQGCRAERIYLNRYAENCESNQEGCNEFILARNSNNNLVGDSSFEYVAEGAFPQNWDLRLKTEVASEAECQGDYYTTCFVNGGYNNISQANCTGEFKQYCIAGLLRYNRCDNPQFSDTAGGKTAAEKCADNKGTWVEECQIGGVVESKLGPGCEGGNCQYVCENLNGGSWNSYCKGAVLYGSVDQNNPKNVFECLNILGEWKGYGPFSDLAAVSKDSSMVNNGTSKLVVKVGNLPASAKPQELQLVYRLGMPAEGSVLTKSGDAYTASAFLSANQTLTSPIGFNLVKTYLGGDEEVNSSEATVNQYYTRANTTLLTTSPGTNLQILINIPGNQPGAEVYIDSAGLNVNTMDQLRNLNLLSDYGDYENNSKVYYKRPPETLGCHGYGPGDPAPVLTISPFDKVTCESASGYWDEGFVYKNTLDCYQYKPDEAVCNNFLKICQADEVGCQMFTPLEGGPGIPGVVSPTDYCPAECVGYDTYKQDPILYEPKPDPLYHYFIPNTAKQCSWNEVGCSQFTNLDEVAKGGEGVEYYTYLRQCIKPGQGLGEKEFFTWQSIAGSPQIIKYQFQADSATGAPKTINGEGDCQLIDYATPSEAFNCLLFFDGQGNEFNRDIRNIVSVSEDCHPYRKTEATEENCTATNGRWEAATNSCVYDAIPNEGIACRAEVNGCRAFIGNQGNNVYVQSFDNFEGSDVVWNAGTGDGTGLSLVGEALQRDGQSLFVTDVIDTINKPVEIEKGNLYVLSFWAKSETQGDTISIGFSTAQDDGAASTLEEFASLDPTKVSSVPPVILSNDWKNYNLGPVYVSWDDVTGNRLVFDSIEGKTYFDNITLKLVKDNIYVVKNSWVTPDICNKNMYGLTDPNNSRPMLGCKAYDDKLNVRHNLKSFTNLCRESVVGCDLLIDTKNSVSANSQSFNQDNGTILDDYTVSADQLEPYVLSDDHLCDSGSKGCQNLGRPLQETGVATGGAGFEDVYLLNSPDKYADVPNSIMCNHDALGCVELKSDAGVAEYYKIDNTKLCAYTENIVNGQKISGWFKKGSDSKGCASLNYNTQAECQNNGGWSSAYGQCVPILSEIFDPDTCALQNGEWINGNCLANPFQIYKVYEANKYKGYVGECSNDYNGCTEFFDVNPNFLSNGGFENVVDNHLVNWSVVNGSSGRQDIEVEDMKDGARSLRLTKLTSQDCPTTLMSGNCTAKPYGVQQKIVQLEKGKTYKASFYYNVPVTARGQGTSCPLPEASISFTRFTGDTSLDTKEEIYTYPAEEGWKKATVLFSVPLGTCSDRSYLTEENCKAKVGSTAWTVLDDLQNYQVALYAPRNANSTNEKNCPNSYVLYDQLEIKDNTEDSYYVIDLSASVNRRDCQAVDWDSGCVQFFNTVDDKTEILKVKKDRDCKEWAYCPEDKIDATTGNCQEVQLCVENQSGKCVRQSAKKDNVRYSLDKDPLLVKRISSFADKSGYIYRFGSGQLSALSQWRAGDYSGYTLAGRFPIETEISKGFSQYPKVNNLDNISGVTPKKEDARFINPVCKIFREEQAPLPYQLSQQQGYKDILKKYSPGTVLTGENSVGNLCNYAEVKTETLNNPPAYFPIQTSWAGVQLCPDQNDQVRGGKMSVVATACAKPGEPVTSVTNVTGIEGMCLEFDTLNSLYDGIYKDTEKIRVCDTQTPPVCTYKGPDYQPYACLTYFPFSIDVTPYK